MEGDEGQGPTPVRPEEVKKAPTPKTEAPTHRGFKYAVLIELNPDWVQASFKAGLTADELAPQFKTVLLNLLGDRAFVKAVEVLGDE